MQKQKKIPSGQELFQMIFVCQGIFDKHDKTQEPFSIEELEHMADFIAKFTKHLHTDSVKIALEKVSEIGFIQLFGQALEAMNHSEHRQVMVGKIAKTFGISMDVDRLALHQKGIRKPTINPYESASYLLDLIERGKYFELVFQDENRTEIISIPVGLPLEAVCH